MAELLPELIVALLEHIPDPDWPALRAVNTHWRAVINNRCTYNSGYVTCDPVPIMSLIADRRPVRAVINALRFTPPATYRSQRSDRTRYKHPTISAADTRAILCAAAMLSYIGLVRLMVTLCPYDRADIDVLMGEVLLYDGTLKRSKIVHILLPYASRTRVRVPITYAAIANNHDLMVYLLARRHHVSVGDVAHAIYHAAFNRNKPMAMLLLQRFGDLLKDTQEVTSLLIRLPGADGVAYDIACAVMSLMNAQHYARVRANTNTHINIRQAMLNLERYG